MITGTNKLTPAIKRQLRQGTKVEFKWHGSDRLYTGRIEISEYKLIYFCSEHNYKNDKLTEIGETMKHYNLLESFYHFNYFEII